MAHVVIKVVGNKHFEPRFYGYYSGYNSVIMCMDNAKCTIKCDGFGCIGLKLICDTTSNTGGLHNDSIVNINNYNEDGLLDNNTYYRGLYVYNDRDYNPIQERLIYSIPSYSINTECNTAFVCVGKEIAVTNSTSNVYCSGLLSCYNCVVTFNSTADDSSIYCTGDRSCEGGILNAEYGSKHNSVYCGGFKSCTNTTIFRFQYVYILGYYGATYSEIISNNVYNEMNVYFAAYMVVKI